jgi:hypothetical protein
MDDREITRKGAIMKIKNLLFIGLIALLASGFATSSAQTQQQQVSLTVAISNVCTGNTVLTIQAIQLSNSSGASSLQLFPLGEQIQAGQTKEFPKTLNFTPTILTLVGLINQTPFSVKFDPLALNTTLRDDGAARGCLQVVVKTATGGTTQPGEKPVREGQNLDQVLAALQTLGVSVSTEGSQANPKFPDVDDPMLLRVIGGLSAQLLFVSAPGTLRSVITWDRPAVDLDLIVLGFGFCFQLTPPGVLAETCDRAPFGPVPGVVFAVLIINWSATATAYVLSLSP